MSIIFQLGGTFWIESFQTTITLEDASGTDASSIITLEREGIFIGGSVQVTSGTVSNDNSQALGGVRLMTSALGVLNLGTLIQKVRLLAEKQTGTAGNTSYQVNVILFMRGKKNG